MAITSAIMQMRRGEEEYFDPDKMHPGEWAVSTDTKYVRMCFSPGVCVRMATYEAFEEDMEQIISILEEANTVKEAIEEIYKEFQEAELDIEAAENAAILSESYAKGGTGTREDEDIDNAKYYAEKAKEAAENASAIASVEIMTTEKAGIGKPDGETIIADEDGTMRVPSHSDVALNRQTLGYTKKNWLKLFDNSQTINGIKYSVNVNEGTITIDGKATAYSYSGMGFAVEKKYIKAGAYIFNGCPPGGRVDGVDYYRQTLTLKYADGTTGTSFGDYGEDITFSVTQEEEERGIYLHYTIYVFPNKTVDNLTFRPMVRSADIVDDTFEPYVDDVDTRLKALTPVNNLLATVPGSPLDAVQGKVMNDKIAAIGTIYTTSAASQAKVARTWTETGLELSLPAGKYIINAIVNSGYYGTAGETFTVRLKENFVLRNTAPIGTGGAVASNCLTCIYELTNDTTLHLIYWSSVETGAVGNTDVFTAIKIG